MAREGGFFSPNRKTSGKDKQVASSSFTQIDDTSFLDRDDNYNKEMNSIYGEKNYQKLPGFIKKDIKLDYLDRNPIKYKKFLDSSFAPSGYEVGKIARSEISEADDFKNSNSNSLMFLLAFGTINWPAINAPIEIIEAATKNGRRYL